jgi:hypothetical protein
MRGERGSEKINYDIRIREVLFHPIMMEEWQKVSKNGAWQDQARGKVIWE